MRRKTYPQRIKTLSSLQVRKPSGDTFIVRTTVINQADGDVFAKSLVKIQSRPRS